MRARKTLARLALLALALLVLIPMTLNACSSTAALGLTAEGVLAPCPSTPNCVCSERPAPRIEPLAFEGDPDAALASLVAFLRAEPRVEVIVAERDYVHAAFATRLFRFRDDLELRLDRAARCIHVRSASRVGYSDLGTNRRRVESIRKRWVPPR